MSQDEFEDSPRPPEREVMEAKPAYFSPAWQIVGGFLITIAANTGVVGLIGAMFPRDYTAVIATVAIGLIQWLWLAPLAIFVNAKGRKHLRNGILISASIVSFLNAACWSMALLK